MLTVLTGLTVGMVLTLAILMAVDEAPTASVREQKWDPAGRRKR